MTRRHAGKFEPGARCIVDRPPLPLLDLLGRVVTLAERVGPGPSLTQRFWAAIGGKPLPACAWKLREGEIITVRAACRDRHGFSRLPGDRCMVIGLDEAWMTPLPPDESAEHLWTQAPIAADARKALA